MTGGRGVGRQGAWLVAAAALALAGPLEAQERADSTASVDSTRIKVMERLKRLSRGPGADSLLFIQDSLAAERERNSGARNRSARSAGDSTMATLLSMPGYALTRYEGESAEFEAADRTLFLHGGESRARVVRDGMEVTADSTITYSERERIVRATGDPAWVPQEGDPVNGRLLLFDLDQGRGTALGARTKYSSGANWIVSGDLPSVSPEVVYGDHTSFTSCEEEKPHYHFEASEVKIAGGRILVAKDVKLYFADVPVAWLPFIAQSLGSGRASGILTPRFSINDIVRTSGGYRRRISNLGFFWAMSDYTDAILALDWFSENFLSLTGSFRYKLNSKFLQGGVNLRRYWRRDGSSELAFDTRHTWELDERTSLRASGRFASSTSFVRQNSFNPQEVTQSIDSEGGINRRFDWGNVSLSANRRQYMSDDRVEWTLPSANVSLSTITLFPAPSGRARFWNNITWSGSANVNRRTVDRVQPDTFSTRLANTQNLTGGVNTSVGLGNLRLSQSLRFTRNTTRSFPDLLWPGARPDSLAREPVLVGVPAGDISQTELNWSTSVDYQQRLIGSTTLTPRLSFSGRMMRGDTVSAAQSLVSAPSRLTLSAALKTDIYGFWPGFGSYDRVRHKISPSFQYEWSPAVTPSELQTRVFRGARAIRPTNTLSVTLNQTFEAKKNPPEKDSTTTSLQADTAAAGSSGEPRRIPRGEIVSLLAIRTSVVRYNFVTADSLGAVLSGFETTRLSNKISSDFLRGLSLSMDHELFEDSKDGNGDLVRKFSPHLAQVNLGFSLGSSSGLVRWLGKLVGRGGGTETTAEEPEATAEPGSPFGEGPTDESSVVPTTSRRTQPQPRQRGAQGGWSANLSYSLQRPRDARLGRSSQMLSGMVTLRPTERWDVSWRTSYDLERGAFNDHTIRLTRDLHRWTANFDFLQTATGNWTFRFNVSLLDNQDLKFDYEQRNLDAGLSPSQRAGAVRR